MIGLPAIQKAKLPPLHPNDPNEVACLLQPKMTVPVEGAPLVFATNFAHGLVLHLNRTGVPTDIPLTPDAFEGGLVAAKDERREQLHDLKPADAAAVAKSGAKIGSATDLTITGTLHGYWGFDAFDGPTITIQQVAGKNWKIVGDTQLLAGQDNHLMLKADGSACVRHVALASDVLPSGVMPSDSAKDVEVNFKPAPGADAKDTVAVDVSLKTVEPGGYSLEIQQYGDASRDKVPLTAYVAGIKLDDLKIHRGDDSAVLDGEGLKDVASVEIEKQTFTPTGAVEDRTLHLHAGAGVSPKEGAEATVKLKDGRTMPVKITSEAARPGLNLVSLKATAAPMDGGITVTLGAKDDIPLEGKLTFVVQTKEVFPRTQTIEVATADGSVHTTLSLASENLVLQDDHTAVGTLDPLKAFGPSAFGRLAMRPVAADGTAGNWTGLGTLVRAPQISAIHCTADAATCTVDGKNFYLVQAFGATKDFAKPTEVPNGFAENNFQVPMPADGATLYLKLRDDPGGVASVTLPAPVGKTAAPATPATPAAHAAPAPAAPPQGPAQ